MGYIIKNVRGGNIMFDFINYLQEFFSNLGDENVKYMLDGKSLGYILAVTLTFIILLVIIVISISYNRTSVKALRAENKLLRQQIKAVKDYAKQWTVKFELIEKRISLIESKSNFYVTSTVPIPRTNKGDSKGHNGEENRYFRVGSGEASYYINEKTGEKKVSLGENDVEIVPHLAEPD